MKLFSVVKEEHMNRVKINLLGIRFKMTLEKNIFEGFWDGLCAKLLIPVFIYKNKKYIQNKSDSVTRRLFITTGNINFVNNLAIINQFNLKNNSQNDVIVWSGVANKEFFNLYENISQKFGMNNFFSFVGSSKNFRQYLIKNFFTDYDEIYFINLEALGLIIQKIYKYSSLIITDEGVCTILPIKCINYNNVNKMIFSKYLGKIDCLGFDENIKSKIVELKKEEFQHVADECTKLAPLKTEIKEDEKWVVLCGTFNGWRGATFEDVVREQKLITEKLISKGYKILFKPHPRDLHKYEESENFKLFDTRLSLECYRIPNIAAVISLYSSVSLQIYHYQDVPSFILTEKILDIEALNYRLISQYAPSVELLYDIDTDCSAAELTARIRGVYNDWLNKKPLLSENYEMIKLYDKLVKGEK